MKWLTARCQQAMALWQSACQRAVAPWKALSERARSLRQDAPAAPLPVRFTRDPDLDSAHERQHDLIQVATSISGHEQVAERMRRRWSAEAEFWQRPMESSGGSH